MLSLQPSVNIGIVLICKNVYLKLCCMIIVHIKAYRREEYSSMIKFAMSFTTSFRCKYEAIMEVSQCSKVLVFTQWEFPISNNRSAF